MVRITSLLAVLFLAVFPAYAAENTGIVLDTQGVALVQFHTLYGMPLGAPETNKLIARSIYCMSNNRDTKFADWVAYRIDSQTVSGSSTTKRNWKADPLLPGDETLEPEDYKGANKALKVDRGHQAPLASFKGTEYWYETNYLSNITPQRSALNQGPWKQLEDRVREIAAKQSVFVMTGPLYERYMEALPGADEPHRVPSGYWKIIAVQTHGEFPLLVTAYIFDQETGRKSTIGEHIVTVDEVEQRSGLDFFWKLPDDVESTIESTLSANDSQ